jgi:peroxiredoxin
MRHLVVLLLTAATLAHAQSAEDLLRSAEAIYKGPNSYEIKGKAVVQLSDAPWQVTVDLTIASNPSSSASGTPQKSSGPGVMIGGFHAVKTSGAANGEAPPVSFGPAIIGWDRIAQHVSAVREVGSETLPLNGSQVPCRILQVDYNPTEHQAPIREVTYSICSDKHLVLRKTLSYSAGRRATDPPALWTLTFDSATFNAPPPAWLANLQTAPALATRKEWIGRAAPDFSLKDLNGKPTKLSSALGKVVLLDFWSIACPPCVHGLPMIESTAASYKSKDILVWGISFDQADQIKQWFSERQQSLPTLVDPDFAVSDLYKVEGIPATLVIGRDGKIRDYWTGEVPQQDLESAIQLALKQ